SRRHSRASISWGVNSSWIPAPSLERFVDVEPFAAVGLLLGLGLLGPFHFLFGLGFLAGEQVLPDMSLGGIDLLVGANSGVDGQVQVSDGQLVRVCVGGRLGIAVISRVVAAGIPEVLVLLVAIQGLLVPSVYLLGSDDAVAVGFLPGEDSVRDVGVRDVGLDGFADPSQPLDLLVGLHSAR